MHHLHIASLGAALIAEVVAVRDGALSDVGHDFHIAMRMWVEPGSGRHLVVVPYPQPAYSHPFRIVVAAETEVMMRVQPFVAKTAETGKRSELDHADLHVVRY